MLRIRLARMGRKSLPFYRIVVMDGRKRRDGRYSSLIGTYCPFKKEVKMDLELYRKYLSDGAQPTDIVAKLYSKLTNE